MATPSAELCLYDVQVDAQVHRYAVKYPAPGAHGPARVPCVVFLHGRGESGTDGFKPCIVGLVAASLSSESAEPWGPFVIIAPQKPNQVDTWEQHESLVLACLQDARRILAARSITIDPDRTYLTGLSQGGAGTWAIGARQSDLFAAIAPVCGFAHSPPDQGTPQGTVLVGDDAHRRAIAEPLVRSRMPIWAFHGERDDAVLPEQTRKLVAAVESLGGSAEATYYPEANHNAWDPTYRDRGAELAAWFLGHTRPARRGSGRD